MTQEITALLREQIARKRLSYVAVAEAATIPTSTFNDIVNGRKPIDIEQLDRIAWAVGYSIDELVAKAEANTSNRQTSESWPAKRLIAPS